MLGDVLEFGSDDWVSCQPKITMLITISATVTAGNRRVGMLSLTGIRGREAYGGPVGEAPVTAGEAPRACHLGANLYPANQARVGPGKSNEKGAEMKRT